MNPVPQQPNPKPFPVFLDLPPILNADDVARVFKVCRRVAVRWLGDGTMPSTKIGKARYVRREDVLQMLEPERPGRRV